MSGRSSLGRFVVPAAALMLISSCAASGIRLYVNPDADMAFYKAIAVLPFSNISTDGLAGPRVTRGFITALLMANRYQIIQPDEFRAALSKVNGLPGPDGAYDANKLKDAATQVGATGILRGAVSEYGMQRSEGGDIPIVGFDAELMDVATGNVVWRASIAERGKGRVPIFGGGSRSLGRLLQDACDHMVEKLRKGAM